MLGLPFYYIRWHYTQALSDLVNIVRNFLWFFNEFFSIPLLLKTMFVPFHRLDEHTPRGFHPDVWLENIVVNFLMRIVGVVLRLTLILTGLFCIACTFVLGVLLFVAWLLVPLILFLTVTFGLTFLLG